MDEQLSDTEMESSGVRPDMIRVAVGIEHINDIIYDFDQALAQVTVPAEPPYQYGGGGGTPAFMNGGGVTTPAGFQFTGGNEQLSNMEMQASQVRRRSMEIHEARA